MLTFLAFPTPVNFLVLSKHTYFANFDKPRKIVDLEIFANIENLAKIANVVDLATTANFAIIAIFTNFTNSAINASFAGLAYRADTAKFFALAKIKGTVDVSSFANLANFANPLNLRIVRAPLTMRNLPSRFFLPS